MPWAAKPVRHSYWSLCSRAWGPQQEKPPQREAYALPLGSRPHVATRQSPGSSEDPAQPKVDK